jgi:hypothetical protein
MKMNKRCSKETNEKIQRQPKIHQRLHENFYIEYSITRRHGDEWVTVDIVARMRRKISLQTGFLQLTIQ